MLIARSRIRSIKCGGHLLEDCPNTRSWASAAKDHSAQFVAETLGFLWVGSVAETRGKLEKLFLLALLSLDPVLDEFHQHPAGTKPAGPCHAANLRCDVCRKTDALTYCFVYRPHNSSMHHNGAIVQVVDSRLVRRSRKTTTTDAVCLGSSYRSPEEFENESEDRNGDASFGTATMRVFKTLTGIQN